MQSNIEKTNLLFEGPGKYRIDVLGQLDAAWSDRLGGMQITIESAVDGKTVTNLVGHLRDQAQLSGILNTLYDLYLPILLVQYLPEKD